MSIIACFFTELFFCPYVGRRENVIQKNKKNILVIIKILLLHIEKCLPTSVLRYVVSGEIYQTRFAGLHLNFQMLRLSTVPSLG